MNNTEVGKIFRKIVENLSDLEGDEAMDIDGILLNWNNSELNQDRNDIISYPERDEAYSSGMEGGKVKVSKKTFIIWILSDALFNEEIFGKDIHNDKEWTKAIEIARTSIAEILG